ncbi:hypothetical protein CQJ94_09415 [Glycomyces fuscus]|nr:hypothetical protein CQJ94_09415 [Glycomyces fuscus]
MPRRPRPGHRSVRVLLRSAGHAVTRPLPGYALHVTNLRCVYLTAVGPGAGAVRAYEKTGSKRQGARRNSDQWPGQTVNEVLRDAIPEELRPPLVGIRFQERTSGARRARRAHAPVGAGRDERIPSISHEQRGANRIRWFSAPLVSGRPGIQEPGSEERGTHRW